MLHRTARSGVIFFLFAFAAMGQGAQAARWQGVAGPTTRDDGPAITGAWFEGRQVLDSLTLPYFTLDGVRYALTSATRTTPPAYRDDIDGNVVTATYRVPTRAGDVRFRVTHRFIDHDTQYDDLGVLSSHVAFDGPPGHYRFYWRVDLALDGNDGDRVQVFTPAGRRGYWAAGETEQSVTLPPDPGDDVRLEFDRFLLRVVDGPDYAHQVQVRLEPPSTFPAVAFVVRNHADEEEAFPEDLVNGEPIQRIAYGQPIPQPVQGSDIVLWYRADVDGSAGDVGPDMYVAAMSGRQAVIEFDKMASTNYPPATSVLQGETISVESAFAKAGITINDIIKGGTIPEKDKLSMAELDAVMESNITYQEEEDTPTQWYSWFGLVHAMYMPGVLGIMPDYYEYSSDDAYREGAFAFYDEIVTYSALFTLLGFPPQDADQWLLMTVAHETGHAYNQHHEDYWMNEESCFYEDSSIMGYSFDVTNHLYWDFGPNSDASMRGGDPDEYVRPGHGVDFVSDSPRPYPYNTTLPHQRGHHWTGEFSGGGCMFGLDALYEDETQRASGGDNWRLEVATTRSQFQVGEPVSVQVTLSNIGSDPLTALPRFAPGYGAAQYWIHRPDGTWYHFQPMERLLVAPQTLWQTFEPGDWVREEADIFADKFGWIFDEPGHYQIRVVFSGYHPDALDVVSNTLDITVVPGTARDAAAANLMTHGEAVLLVRWGQGDHLTEGLATLRRVIARYPDTLAALYAHQALGAAAARPFFDGVTERPPRPQEAVMHLEPVYSALADGRLQPPSRHFAHDTAEWLASAYDALGRHHDARAVRQTLASWE